MRLVEDDRVCRRQKFGHAGVFQCDVGKEQVVVDHHNVGLLGFLAGLHDKAVLVVLTLRTETGIAGGRDQVPDQGGFRDGRQLRLVAGGGGLHEAGNLAQMPDVVARRHAAILQRALQMKMTDVVRTPLQQRYRHRHVQGAPHRRNVAQIKLVLQVLGAGRDDRLAAPKQRRNQVSKGLAGTGAGLRDQGALGGDRIGDRLGHLGLRMARAVAADRASERAGGAEQLVEFEVVRARRSVGGGGSQVSDSSMVSDDPAVSPGCMPAVRIRPMILFADPAAGIRASGLRPEYPAPAASSAS